MGTNIGGQEFTDFRQENPSHSTDGGILRELYLHMTSPEEEQRKKADAAAKPTEKPAPDAIGFLGQLVGDAKNLAMDAVTGNHSGDRVLSSITPQLAADYQRGKNLQERLDSGAVKRTQLKPDDLRSLDAYDKVKKTLAQVPMYDRDSLTRYVEKGIEQKAKTATHEATRPAPAREAAKPQDKPIAQHVARESSDAKKAGGQTAPQARKDAHPAATPEVKTAIPKSSQPAQSARIAEVNLPSAKPTPGKPEQVNPTPASKDARIEGVKPARLDSQTVQNIEPRTHAAAERKDTVSNTNSPAASTFERRTAYDARSESESKQISFQNSEPKLYTRPVSHDDVQDTKVKNSGDGRVSEKNLAKGIGKVGDTGSFEDMRRLLEERATAHNSPLRRASPEQLPPKSLSISNEGSKNLSAPDFRDSGGKRPNEIDTIKPAIGAGKISTDDNRRLVLADVKNSLTPARIQEIIQISQTRFPAGLRWENSLRPVDLNLSSVARKQSDVVSPPAPAPARQDAATGRIADGGAKASSDLSPTHSDSGRLADGSAVRLPDGASVRAPDGLSAQSQDGTVRSAKDGASAKTQGKPVNRGDIPSANSTEQPLSTRGNTAAIGRTNQPVRMPDGQSVGADWRSEKVPLPTLTFKGRVEDRYITGVEIALAAIVAAAGAKRVRLDEIVAQNADGKFAMPRVQKIEAFLPNAQNAQSDMSAHRRVLKSSLVENGEEEGNGTSVPDQMSSAPPPPQPRLFGRRTVLIGPGDTLVTIAEGLADSNAKVAWLIADINLSRIKESYVDGKRIVEIRSREQIELPTEAEIYDFLQLRSKDCKAEDLITVVIETQIDRELLDEQLGVLVDGQSRQGTIAGGTKAGASIPSRTAVNSDGSVVFPPLAFNSNVFTVAKERLLKFTRQVFEGSNLRFSKTKYVLKRENIKRRF